MKTPKELNVLKNEVETLNKKLTALSDEELAPVSGGTGIEASQKSYSERVEELRNFLSGKLDEYNINQILEAYQVWYKSSGMSNPVRVFLDFLLKFNIIDNLTYEGIINILFLGEPIPIIP